MIVERAPAKLNLALHVRARRADGYHELETLFAFVADGDTLTLEDAAEDRFVVTGPFAAGLTVEGDNLVTRARDRFRQAFSVTTPCALTLDKHLPIASGIGGGSADAAATLRALAHRHGVASDDRRLVACAESLGSDVPACLSGRTALGQGRGERLASLDGLRGMAVLLVNPGVAVSTAAVFRDWDGVDRGALPEGTLLARAVAGRNDLQAPAVRLAPIIADVLDRLRAVPGVALARMSGSGATCFALFEDAAALPAAAEAMRGQGWWCLETVLA